MRTVRNVTLSALCALSLVSCTHKKLWYGTDLWTWLDVRYDWSSATGNPDVGSVDLYLFRMDDIPGDPEYNQLPMGGGTIRVPYGMYYGVAFNNDTGSLIVDGADSLNSLYLYTRDESILSPLGIVTKNPPTAKGTEGQRCVLSPDFVWTGRRDGFDVVFSEEKQTRTVRMEDAWQEVVVEVRGVKNFKYLSNVSGALSGLAEGYYPGRGELSAGQVIIPFGGLKLDAKSVREAWERLRIRPLALQGAPEDEPTDSVFGELVCFGHCPDRAEPHDHILTIYAVLTSGEKYMYTFDVTEQFHKQWDDPLVHVVIDELPLPVPISPEGSGINVSADDWYDVVIGITMK